MRSPSDKGPVNISSPFTNVPPMLPLSVIEIPASSQVILTWADADRVARELYRGEAPRPDEDRRALGQGKDRSVGRPALDDEGRDLDDGTLPVAFHGTSQ